MSQDEQIPIVDKDDNLLRHKRRGDMTDDECKRVCCVWVENGDGKVLLQQRANTVQVDPGEWSVAALGTVTDDDSYDETAGRELEEEIGLNDFALTKTKKLYYKASFGWRQAQGYIVTCDWPIEKFTPQPEEVQKLEWVDKQQLLNEIAGRKPLSKPYVSTYKYWPELFKFET